MLLLGVAFKRNLGDVRNSPALKVVPLLREHGIEVAYHDPFVPRLRVGEDELRSEPLSPPVLSAADCVLIHTDHEAIDYAQVVAHARLVFDARNATRHVKTGRERIVRL